MAHRRLGTILPIGPLRKVAADDGGRDTVTAPCHQPEWAGLSLFKAAAQPNPSVAWLTCVCCNASNTSLCFGIRLLGARDGARRQYSPSIAAPTRCRTVIHSRLPSLIAGASSMTVVAADLLGERLERDDSGLFANPRGFRGSLVEKWPSPYAGGVGLQRFVWADYPSRM